VTRLLRDKQLLDKFALSKSELWRRRQNDPDFPKSFLAGANMRVTEEADADRYIEILKTRKVRGLPTPGARPRGRPRRSASRGISV
jgi:predicted DNA-binding transcriptional regulator AlpA